MTNRSHRLCISGFGRHTKIFVSKGFKFVLAFVVLSLNHFVEVFYRNNIADFVFNAAAFIFFRIIFGEFHHRVHVARLGRLN